MLTQSQRSTLTAVAVLLFVPVMFLQSKIDPARKQYEPADARNNGAIVSKLPIEFALGALTGFREAAAGLLWVRTDEFFHNGDYEAITPMIRLITWLDPHQIDVYETGAWHMDYNFTDTDQRSDRRYIPLSISLMKEGIANNSNIPDMYADLAFTHFYRKMNDFKQASIWFRQGQDQINLANVEAMKSTADPSAQDAAKAASYAITTTSHGLAHSLEAIGDIAGAQKQWQYCIQMHTQNRDKYPEDKYAESNGIDTATKQLYELTQRTKWRQTTTKNPIDVGFTAQIERVAPKVFVIKGTFHAIGATKFNLETGEAAWGPIDGCRIDMRLEDAGYKMPVLASFNLNSIGLNPNTTIMQESASVRDGKFQKKIDMSKDPQMYSFAAPKYTFTLWFNPSNPASCPPNVQDRVGWFGQGMTDKSYLDTSGVIPGDVQDPMPGLRLIKKTFTLTREDLLGADDKVFTN